MREILPTLYASHVNKEHCSLTSPMQESVDKTNPTTTENCSYQRTENLKLDKIICIKCRCVQEVSALELQRQRYQQREDNCYICNKCMLSSPSVVNFVTHPTGVLDTESKKERTLNKILNTFKVKNVQPDKHYCDKCRFSTKDPVQYKKHVTQHEEIKFVCAICNCVSYTKGEFKRHLVKHTGKFPYQCKYCDYGAIRHDYIIKHINRLHKTITDQQVQLTTEKAEQKINCLTKQSSEKSPSQEVPLQNKSSTVSFNTVMNEIKDETPEIVCTSSTECNQGTVLSQDKYIIEPPDIGIYEDAIIEVEVCSPQKQPVMPGMPLTVVAPAKFVAPPNCLAEVVEVKNVDGAQQLVLKLIPAQEITSRSMKCETTEYVNEGAEQAETSIGGSMSLTFADSCMLDNYECYNDLGWIVSPTSSASLCNLVNIHKENILCKENEERENLVVVVGEPSSDEINCPKNICLNFDFSSPTCLTCSPPEDDNKLQSDFLDAVQENYSDLPSQSHAGLHQNKPVFLNDTRTDLATLNEMDMEGQKENVCVDSSKVLNVKNEGGSDSEGPVISSVFSLSSGTVNIPEGIKWDDKIRKKSSASLLCRKIAQLMSAVESNMKSQLAGSLRHDKSLPKEKMLSSPEIPDQLERKDIAVKLEPESEPSPQSSTDATFPNGDTSREAQPIEAPARARAKKRMVKKTHASPVFIPQGTVLRVFEGLTDSELRSKTLPSPVLVGDNTFLPRPVPCVSEKCTEIPCLPTENGVMKTAKNQNALHQHKRERKKSKQNRVLPFPKSSEINKPKGGAMKNKKTKKKRKKANAGENLAKKSPQSREDCYIVKADPILTRCLRLIPFKKNQLIKCPHRNQPVVVLNHPDVDVEEIINVMKIINKYKCNVVKAIFSERTISYLGMKRQHRRLTFQNFDRVAEMKELNALKMKLKKIHRNMYKVVNSSPADASMKTFKCWFCGRTYNDQEEWISHGQKHLLEATRGWDVPCSPVENNKEEIIVD